jgi:hypothetical protein
VGRARRLNCACSANDCQPAWFFVGNVVSVPNAWPIRFECSHGSSLPKTLRDMGYVPRTVGTIERLMPTPGDQISAVNLEIYELDL